MNVLLPYALVGIGLFLLFSSLFATWEIDRTTQNKADWRILGAFIIVFFIGYAGYFYLLTQSSVSSSELYMTWILFGGGLFVYLVTRSSLQTIQQVQSMADLERHRALHDELTELPNRTLLDDRLDQALLNAKRQDSQVSVVLMDLDRFKEINDVMGHIYGDFILQQVAQRLQKVVRETDTLARLGGDEFTLVLPGSDMENTIKKCYAIAEEIEKPFTIEGNDVSIGVSIGISVFPDHGADSESLLQKADVAMYEAKRNEIVYAVYDPSHDQSTWDRLILISELREAINKGYLSLFYQPKVSLKGSRYEVSGVEALARWHHPAHGYISPDQFIDLAEQAGLMKSLTFWVLDEALRQQAEWKEQGLTCPVAVNLSVKNLHDYDFPETVGKLISKWHTDPNHLTLEITENCMMHDPDRVQKVVQELFDMGLHMSVDDYGAGYSSLAYLRKFPAIEVKIDKSLVGDIHLNGENAVIVQSTIDLIHNIGKNVVAEGVEDLEVLEILHRQGCDTVQGFQISRPMPPHELVAWMKDTPWNEKKIALNPAPRQLKLVYAKA